PRLSLTKGTACLDAGLSAEAREAAHLLEKKGSLPLKVLKDALGKGAAERAMAGLLRCGYAVRTFEMAPPRVRPKVELYVGLPPVSHDVPVSRRSPRREALLAYLRKQPEAVPLAQLKAAGFTRELVMDVRAIGAVVTETRVVRRRSSVLQDMESVPPYKPTPAQQQAIAAVGDSLIAARPEVFLLHGVTGAGKTEVYLQALAQAVRLGKQGIVLVPEIALTPQTAERFAARFPGRTAVLHSGLSLGEQHDTWWDIKNGIFDVVVGARSALFAPLPRLGLIVVDEEHEWAYKQSDHAPRYHARTVSLKLAAVSGAAVVLGSATPDVESYHLAKTGVYRLLELPERLTPHPGAALPAVQVVDLRAELKAGNRSIFSLALQDSMRRALLVGDQIILFFNRRGSAVIVQCRACGHTVGCRSCSVALSYHGAEGALVCHQCGIRKSVPEKCPVCDSRRIRFLGLGTQKVMEEAASLFPEARLLRWDSDAARGKDAHAGILARVRRHEADVLVGTQLVAKGLDLPQVTLVGVVSADTAMGLPDFRAGERTFQILSQVAGRAGRGSRPGRVVIQTYAPDHYAVRAAAIHDYGGFYRCEIELRLALGNPPYGRLVRLTFVHTNDAVCLREAESLKRKLGTEIRARGFSISVSGPAPAFVPRVRGRYLWQLMLKGNNPTEVLRSLELPVNWVVDVDPVGL
ncbi:MAG: primosomal protein N', partial [Dehalococcoidia bacterium]|nr:primosomal protein N' [Dehalococcoidia bacterium]